MPDWKKRFASSYRYMRVDRKTNLDAERLRNICNGGTIERNLDTNYETGKVSYKGTLDFGSDLLRVYLEAAFSDGSVHLEPLGTFLVSTPKRPIGQALARQTFPVDWPKLTRTSSTSRDRFLPARTPLTMRRSCCARSVLK